MTSGMKPSITFSLAIGLTLSPVVAAEYQGAESILKQVAELSADKTGNKESPRSDVLAERIKAFEIAGATLPAEAAATQWLALWDAWRSLVNERTAQAETSDGVQAPDLKALVTVLPPSAAWDGIMAGLETRTGTEREPIKSTLHLFSTILGKDDPARLKAIDAMQAAAGKAGSNFSYYAESYGEEMRKTIEASNPDPGQMLKAFERRLKTLEGPQKEDRASANSALVIPNLVKLAGKEKAMELLDRAVVLEVDLSVDDEETTLACVEAATRNIPRLKVPHWELVRGYEQLPLYEALVKRFPNAKESYNRVNADRVHFIGLIANGRLKEAHAFFTELMSDKENNSGLLDDDVFERMDREGLGEKLIAFMEEELARDPNLPVWEDFASVARLEGKSARFLEILEKTLANPALEPATLVKLRLAYLTNLLEVGRIDEAIAAIRTEIHANDGNTPDAETLELRLDRSIMLLKIGRLLKNPQWIEEGLGVAKECLGKTTKRNYQLTTTLDGLTHELLALDRGAEAEAILSSNLLALSQSKSQEHSYEIKETLTALVTLYDRMNRPADALFLLDHSPSWNASDITRLSSPLPVIAARSLAAAGRIDDAKKIVRRAVQDDPNEDAGYELLLKLGGDDIPALLDSAYTQDRFEERPLIWKARLLLDQGNTADAEKTIRAAIAVDPSDGEQGKGDRLRAYSVLADVLEKKGDPDQAASVRKAVKAIRLSEDADDWYAAGLLSRAVALYEESLGYFDDAYCIQSRLARRQTELGEFEQAAEHYRRAFELMPDSFGRVESHCFGCEGTFSDPKAQVTADKVFSTLVGKLPDRPQVYYLYGYLKEEQGKPEEATALFQKAVKLDPDYLNAWVHLSSTAEAAGLSPSERDDIQLKILHLNPKGDHGSFDIKGFSDLRRLWDDLISLDKSLPTVETSPLYSLAASRQALEERAKLPTTNRDDWYFRHPDEDPHSRKSPREALPDNTLFKQAILLLERALQEE